MRIKSFSICFIPAVISALLCTASFPKPGYWPLAWIALVPLFYALRNCSLKTAFFIGWLFGGVHAVGTAYWVFHALYVHSNAGFTVSILFLLLIVGAGAGLYYALFSCAAHRIARGDTHAFIKALCISAIWVSIEYCRAHLFTGIPWMLFGYSQYPWVRLIQIVDITGVYGLSFMLVLTSSCIFSVLTSPLKYTAAARKTALPAALIILSVLIYGSIRVTEFPCGSPNRSISKTVAAVQSSVPQDKKWKEKHRKKIIGTYLTLTRRALHGGARLIIWPETALSGYLQEEVPPALLHLLQSYNAAALIGGPRHTVKDDGYAYYNSAFYITSRGIQSHYDKMHLFPFGEYFPFGFIDILQLRYGDRRQYTPGERATVFESPAGRFGAVICFEILFPELVRRFVNREAGFIVNISNDAWFGRSSAHYQHFAMSILRAVEFRRPLIRAANTGISAIVHPSGSIIKKLPPFAEDYILHQPDLQNHKTFYCTYGDLFAGLCFLGWAGVFLRKKKKPAGTTLIFTASVR